jgi:SAM-dependent methyltransferase
MQDPHNKIQKSLSSNMLIGILRCLVCGDINLLYHEKDDINNGRIVCCTCGHNYVMRNDIVDALVTNPAIEAERRGNRRLVTEDRYKADDTWLLGLPDTFAILEPRLASQAAYNAMADFDRLMELLDLPPGALVVDLGAGCCWTTWRLAQRGWRTIAADVSEEKYVGLASGDVYMRHYGVHFDRILFDMSAPWPIRDNSVHAIIAFCSIHHAVNLAFTFREASRALMPNGRFAFVEASHGILSPREKSFGDYERDHLGLNEHIYSLSIYARMARQAKLSFQIYPAPSTLQKIEMLMRDDERVRSFRTIKWRIGRYLSFLWAIPLIRRLVAGPVYPLLCVVAGLQFIGLCTKSTSGLESPEASR